MPAAKPFTFICGADDFLTPKATAREIGARARALLRRPRGGQGAPARASCGPIDIDMQARQVRVDGEMVALTRIEFDLVMVAAILTVLGYSTNDKVVVYDRVRENLRKYKTMPLRALIDLSINETLNRTLGTSMTVFLASLPLALFGGQSISGFAWVMLFGIVVGTSSSIFIAAPILLFLGEHRLRRDTAEPKAATEEP